MSNPTNSVLSTRVDQAAKVMKVDPKIVWERLAILGIDKDDESLMLLESDLTQEGDARRVFVEVNGVERIGDDNPISIPIVRFKAGWSILKGKAKSADDVASRINPDASLEAILNAMKAPSQMKDEELLKKYGQNASTEIIDELNRRCNGRAFIVFSSVAQGIAQAADSCTDCCIDIEATIKLLRIARRQETPSTYKLGEKIVRVYRLGEFPMSYVEECPIYSDIVLAADYCERCMESWDGISYEDRIVTRVAKDMGAIDVSSLAKVHELITKLKAEGSKFLLSIPAVALRYEELKEDNKLPNLRRKFSSSRGKSDPFYQKF